MEVIKLHLIQSSGIQKHWWLMLLLCREWKTCWYTGARGPVRGEQCKYVNRSAKVSSVSHTKSLRVKAPGYNKLFTLKHQEIVPSQANDSRNIFHLLRGKASALNYFVSTKLAKYCTDGVREKNAWTVKGCSLCTAFCPSLNLYSQRVLRLYNSCLELLLALWMLSLGHKTIYSFFMTMNTGWSPFILHFYPSLVIIFLLEKVQ